jgi:hypothetical protein
MKKGSIGDPDIYLGSRLKQVVLPNGVEAWMMSPAKYVAESIKTVESYLEKNYDKKLPKRYAAPYQPTIGLSWMSLRNW